MYVHEDMVQLAILEFNKVGKTERSSLKQVIRQAKRSQQNQYDRDQT